MKKIQNMRLLNNRINIGNVSILEKFSVLIWISQHKFSPLKFDGCCIIHFRLYHLIRLFGDVNVAEITAKLQASRRSKVLKKLQNGSIDM